MSSVRRIQQELQESKRQREAFLTSWIPHVLAGRLVICPDETSYVDKVGVYSSTILRRRFGESTSEEVLMKDYPGLTSEDIRVCFEFETLRAHKLL